MERRSFVGGAGMGGILAAGAAPAVVGAQPAVRWRLTSSFPRSLDSIFNAAPIFAKKVSDMTGGRFQISVHPAGELVEAFKLVDAVQAGTVEMGHTVAFYFADRDPVFSLSAAIPFGLNSRQMTAWTYEGNGLRLMREFYAGYGIVNFPGGNTGAQMGGWFKKEIRSLADLKGVKFRVAGSFVPEIMRRIGVLPQTLPGAEIFRALQSGAIDASEWIGPYDDQRLGLNKVAQHYYYPGWWEGGTGLDFFANARAWNSLSAEHKAIFETACSYAHSITQARYDVVNPGVLKQLLAGGTRLAPFPQDVLTAAFRVSNEYYAELSAKNPTWKKIYADYIKFRADQVLWFRIAEAEFDRFMNAQRLQ
jgi:TRAP-type mannitol/chloroaromatic compound transport system substrate-binding protein